MKQAMMTCCAALLLTAAGLSAAEKGGLADDLDVGLEYDATDKVGVQKLADLLLKDPAAINAEKAIQLIGHPALGDINRATRLYEAVKTRVKPEHYAEVKGLLQVEDTSLEVPELTTGAPGSTMDSTTTVLLLRLLGRTRDPGAKDVLLKTFGSSDIILKAGAVEAIGMLGNKELLPMLQREYEKVEKQRGGAVPDDYVGSLLFGMIYLGDTKFLGPLIAKTAATAEAISGAILTIASGYTPPDVREKAQKQLKTLRPRHKILQGYIVEVGPLFPREMAGVIIGATEPNECDVLYRLLPQLVTKEHYADFIPALRSKSWDLRQLVLDLLLEGHVQPGEMQEMRKIVMEWYEGKDEMGKVWSVRNCRVFEPPQRQQILLEVLKNGSRWEQMEAVKEISRSPDKELVDGLKSLARVTSDPDVQFHMARVLGNLASTAPGIQQKK